MPTTLSPRTGLAPSATALAKALTALGQPVRIEAGTVAAEALTLHLARLLVAAAEHHAVAAQLALPRDQQLDDNVDHVQGGYDAAATREPSTLLALTHWRSRRLAAGLDALHETLTTPRRHDEDDPADIWRLTVHTTAAADALIAALTILAGPDPDTPAAIAQIEAATTVLIRTGVHAARMRTIIGLDPLTPSAPLVRRSAEEG